MTEFAQQEIFGLFGGDRTFPPGPQCLAKNDEPESHQHEDDEREQQFARE